MGSTSIGIGALVFILGVPQDVFAFCPPSSDGFDRMAEVILPVFVCFDLIPCEFRTSTSRAASRGAIEDPSHAQNVSMYVSTESLGNLQKSMSTGTMDEEYGEFVSFQACNTHPTGAQSCMYDFLLSKIVIVMGTHGEDSISYFHHATATESYLHKHRMPHTMH